MRNNVKMPNNHLNQRLILRISILSIYTIGYNQKQPLTSVAAAIATPLR